MTRTRMYRLGTALAVAALAACGAEPASSAPKGPQAAQSSTRPGIGRSTEPPVGAPFALPAGLTLESPIYGYAPEDPEKCDDKYDDEAYGHGALVRVCLIFNNTTGAPINVTLPPGLIVVSRSSRVQNGMLTQSVTFEVPAGQRFFAPVIMYCVNGPRSPSATVHQFDLGPVTRYPDFQELFDILEGKDISREDAGEIQVILNHLQNTPGLTAKDRATASSL